VLTLLLLTAGLPPDDSEMEVVAEASIPFAVQPPTTPESSAEDAMDKQGHSKGGSTRSDGATATVGEGGGGGGRVDGAAAGVKFISPRKNMTSFLDPRNVTVEVEVVGMNVPADGSFEVRQQLCPTCTLQEVPWAASEGRRC
jgi:hypothetical protein